MVCLGLKMEGADKSTELLQHPFRYLLLSCQQLGENMFIVKIHWWLDLHHGPLVSEATFLPTMPQPIPKKHPNIWATLAKNCHQDLSKIAQSGHTVHTGAQKY